MAHTDPAFPYFTPTERRPLAPDERAVIERLAQNLGTNYKTQLAGLEVVGRCGCGNCPTIFFQPHTKGEGERDIASYAGTDSSVAVSARCCSKRTDWYLSSSSSQWMAMTLGHYRILPRLSPTEAMSNQSLQPTGLGTPRPAADLQR